MGPVTALLLGELVAIQIVGHGRTYGVFDLVGLSLLVIWVLHIILSGLGFLRGANKYIYIYIYIYPHPGLPR